MRQKASISLFTGVFIAVLLIAAAALPTTVTADEFVIKNKNTCQGLGGTWQALRTCVFETLKVETGDSLGIDGVRLRVNDKIEIRGLLINAGFIDLVGIMQVKGGGKVVNSSQLSIRPSGSIENQFIIENLSEISNGGFIDNEFGIIDNKCQGIIFGSGSFSGNEPLNDIDSTPCSDQRVFLSFVSS